MTTATREPVCLLQVNSGRWCQETYETSTTDSRRRAKQLRDAGYLVTVTALGPQVTSCGVIKLTLVDIRPGKHEDTTNLPPVKVDRLH